MKQNWVRSEEEAKLIVKPWGYATIRGIENVGEVWLNYGPDEEVGEKEKRYVFKRLYIRAGTRSSLQYHERKLETNHLVSGRAEVWMEDENGKMEMSSFNPGDSWTILCGRKHRVVALTDIVMVEASTPEVDDVVRVQDDAGRPSGRIESEHKP